MGAAGAAAVDVLQVRRLVRRLDLPLPHQKGGVRRRREALLDPQEPLHVALGVRGRFTFPLALVSLDWTRFPFFNALLVLSGFSTLTWLRHI